MPQPSSKEIPIDIDEEDPNPVDALLNLQDNPITTPIPRAISSVITSLPFLQSGSSSQVIFSPWLISLSPNFSSFCNKLVALFDNTSVIESGKGVSVSPMDSSTTISSIRNLLDCSADKAFRPQINTIRNSMICIEMMNNYLSKVKD